MSNILTPLSTEKCIRLIESNNTLVFIIKRKVSINDVKKELEKKFKIKISKINTLTDTKGRKKAYVKLATQSEALEIATDLGLM